MKLYEYFNSWKGKEKLKIFLLVEKQKKKWMTFSIVEKEKDKLD